MKGKLKTFLLWLDNEVQNQIEHTHTREELAFKYKCLRDKWYNVSYIFMVISALLLLILLISYMTGEDDIFITDYIVLFVRKHIVLICIDCISYMISYMTHEFAEKADRMRRRYKQK